MLSAAPAMGSAAGGEVVPVESGRNPCRGRKVAWFRMVQRPLWRAAMILVALVAVATLLLWANMAPRAGSPGAEPSATSDEAYLIGSDGAVAQIPSQTPVDPSQTPADPSQTPAGSPASPSDTPNAAIPASAFIDTSVVGLFREPTGVRDHNNWKICGAGALRILLAFVGKNPRWAVAYQAASPSAAAQMVHLWPKMKYKDNWSARYWQPAPFPGGLDTTGKGYMLFIAYSVHPPDWPVDRVGMWDGQSERGYKLVDVANWEYAGEPGYTPDGPFTEGDPTNSFSTFNYSVETQISQKRVPVVVSVMTGSYPPAGNGKVGLPNWKEKTCTLYLIGHTTKRCVGIYVDYKDIPDWIAIVGYDQDYYYYLCTCWNYPERCRHGPTTLAVNYPGSTHPYTWRVAKSLLYWELTRQTVGGWLIYSGPPSDRVTGW